MQITVVYFLPWREITEVILLCYLKTNWQGHMLGLNFRKNKHDISWFRYGMKVDSKCKLKWFLRNQISNSKIWPKFNKIKKIIPLSVKFQFSIEKLNLVTYILIPNSIPPSTWWLSFKINSFFTHLTHTYKIKNYNTPTTLPPI